MKCHPDADAEVQQTRRVDAERGELGRSQTAVDRCSHRPLLRCRAIRIATANTTAPPDANATNRRAALERFVALAPSALEIQEKLEQLRAIEAGMRIDITIVDTVPRGVDTPADLETARRMIKPRSD